jgi:hypothetical protein
MVSPLVEPISVLCRRGPICRKVLESLLEWFGIPASIENYMAMADELRMLTCFDPADDAVGFISVNPYTLRSRSVCDGRQTPSASTQNWSRIDRSRSRPFDLARRPVLDREDALALERRSQLRANSAVLRGRWISADRGIPDVVGGLRTHAFLCFGPLVPVEP